MTYRTFSCTVANSQATEWTIVIWSHLIFSVNLYVMFTHCLSYLNDAHYIELLWYLILLCFLYYFITDRSYEHFVVYCCNITIVSYTLYWDYMSIYKKNTPLIKQNMKQLTVVNHSYFFWVASMFKSRTYRNIFHGRDIHSTKLPHPLTCKLHHIDITLVNKHNYYH